MHTCTSNFSIQAFIIFHVFLEKSVQLVVFFVAWKCLSEEWMETLETSMTITMYSSFGRPSLTSSLFLLWTKEKGQRKKRKKVSKNKEGQQVLSTNNNNNQPTIPRSRLSFFFLFLLCSPFLFTFTLLLLPLSCFCCSGWGVKALIILYSSLSFVLPNVLFVVVCWCFVYIHLSRPWTQSVQT